VFDELIVMELGDIFAWRHDGTKSEDTELWN
jgi:hypothetical protein